MINKGILAMAGACTIWGLSSLVYKQLDHMAPLEILSHRTLWSLVFFLVLLRWQNQLSGIRACFASPRVFAVVAGGALMISINWFLFIWSVGAERATEASLGYFIYPLVAVLIGRLGFGEALRAPQWGAIALATTAVVLLTYGLGVVPLVALTLAVTLGLYGWFKKGLMLPAVVSVTGEVLILIPLAVLFLLQLEHNGGGHFGRETWGTVLLILSGPMTALPLVLFSYAARHANMTSVGLMGYLNPSLQFFCAVVIFAEPFTGWHVISFGMIWAALALYSLSTIAQDRAARRASVVAPASVSTVK